MIKNLKTNRGKKVVYEQFKSLTEMEKIVKSRELTDWVKSRGAVRNGAKDGEKAWTGGIYYNDAYNLLRFGWDKPVAKFSAGLKKIDEKNIKDRNKVMPFKSVYGSKPIVPNALKGLPKSMMNKKIVPKKSKVINVFYEVSRSSRHSAREIEDFGLQVLQHIYNLERKGWRVRLSAFSSHAQQVIGEAGYSWSLIIKDENQPLDVKKVAFPIAHAAMLRLVSFDWFESVPNGEYVNGYGQSLYHWDDIARNDYLKTIGGENCYYIAQGMNLNEIFTNVK